jgi:hypothetical protein
MFGVRQQACANDTKEQMEVPIHLLGGCVSDGEVRLLVRALDSGKFVGGEFVPKSQPFSASAANRPISAAASGPVNLSVFRHAVPRAGFSYVLAECGLRLRDRKKIHSRNGEGSVFFRGAPPVLVNKIDGPGRIIRASGDSDGTAKQCASP